MLSIDINFKQSRDGSWQIYFKCQACKRRIKRLEDGVVFFLFDYGPAIRHLNQKCQKGIGVGTEWLGLKEIFDGLLKGLGILHFEARPPLAHDGVMGTISGSIFSKHSRAPKRAPKKRSGA